MGGDKRNSRRDRVNRNNTKTRGTSEFYEDIMYDYYPKEHSKYDIQYLPERRVQIGNYTTSFNALDSLAKYAGIHNRTLQISERPLMGSRATTRPITKEEALGLGKNETNFGA